MNEYECVPGPLCLQEADRPTCERVEGPPKTASVMQLAEVVTKLDDPVLRDVLIPLSTALPMLHGGDAHLSKGWD